MTLEGLKRLTKAHQERREARVYRWYRDEFGMTEWQFAILGGNTWRRP